VAPVPCVFVCLPIIGADRRASRLSTIFPDKRPTNRKPLVVCVDIAGPWLVFIGAIKMLLESSFCKLICHIRWCEPTIQATDPTYLYHSVSFFFLTTSQQSGAQFWRRLFVLSVKMKINLPKRVCRSDCVV